MMDSTFNGSPTVSPVAAHASRPVADDETSVDKESRAAVSQSRNRVTRYVWITLGVIVLSQGSVVAIQSFFIPSQVRVPRSLDSDLPQALGRWHGRDAAADPATSVGADDEINRIYTSPDGAVVSLHCATWLSTTVSMPHPADLCYTSNGWTAQQSRVQSLPHRPDARIAIEHYRWADRRIVIAHWYQMNERTYVDRSGERSARQAQWGKAQWPPLTKVLLQTDESDHAEARLVEIATDIYDLNCRR